MTGPQLVVFSYPGLLALSLVCIDPGPNRPTHHRRLRLGTHLSILLPFLRIIKVATLE
jgi:hypothetical protein